MFRAKLGGERQARWKETTRIGLGVKSVNKLLRPFLCFHDSSAKNYQRNYFIFAGTSNQ